MAQHAAAAMVVVFTKSSGGLRIGRFDGRDIVGGAAGVKRSGSATELCQDSGASWHEKARGRSIHGRLLRRTQRALPWRVPHHT
jgi:hypothetical protein